jgi:hypothetical protein
MRMAEKPEINVGEQEKLEERLKKLEGLSGLAIPKDRLADRKRVILREFNKGGGI